SAASGSVSERETASLVGSSETHAASGRACHCSQARGLPFRVRSHLRSLARQHVREDVRLESLTYPRAPPSRTLFNHPPTHLGDLLMARIVASPLLALFLAASALIAAAPPVADPDEPAARALDQKVMAAAKKDSEVMKNLTHLSDEIGPRLT